MVEHTKVLEPQLKKYYDNIKIQSLQPKVDISSTETGKQIQSFWENICY